MSPLPPTKRGMYFEEFAVGYRIITAARTVTESDIVLFAGLSGDFNRNLLNDPGSYIFTWLGTYGGATGAIAGVLIADYWVLRRTSIHLADLYKAGGIYRYNNGWNWIAVVALLVGIVFAIGGAYSTGGAPFPEGGIIPLLKPLYDYSWVVGLIVAFVVYWGLMRLLPSRDTARQEMVEQQVA